MDTSFDQFPKKTKRGCLDFETKYFATSTHLQLDSRHSLIYWWCCWILGNGSSNYGKFTRILLKIFYPGLELVGDEKHPPFECYFTEVIPPNNIWWRSRSSHPMSSFSKQIWAVAPLPWSFQSFQWSPLLGSQLRLMPPFVLLKIKWSPPKKKTILPPPQGINNDRPVGTSEIIFWHLNMALLKREDSWYAVTLKVIHLRSHWQ